MLPEFELVLRHVKIAARDLAQPNIAAADNKLALRITHRRRPVAAPAGLVKHQLAVFVPKLLDDGGGFFGDFNSPDLVHLFFCRTQTGSNISCLLTYTLTRVAEFLRPQSGLSIRMVAYAPKAGPAFECLHWPVCGPKDLSSTRERGGHAINCDEPALRAKDTTSFLPGKIIDRYPVR